MASALARRRRYNAFGVSFGSGSLAMVSISLSQMAGWYNCALSKQASSQNIVSEHSGHPTTVLFASKGGSSVLQASQSDSLRRLFAVRTEYSSRTVSPGWISSFANNPNER